jgi:hypothetical protein
MFATHDQAFLARTACPIVDDRLHADSVARFQVVHAFANFFYYSAKLVTEGKRYLFAGNGVRRCGTESRSAEVFVQIAALVLVDCLIWSWPSLGKEGMCPRTAHCISKASSAISRARPGAHIPFRISHTTQAQSSPDPSRKLAQARLGIASPLCRERPQPSWSCP